MSAMSWVRITLGVLALATIIAGEVLGWSLGTFAVATLGAIAGWVTKDPEALAAAKVTPPA